MYHYRLGVDLLDRSSAENDLGMLVDNFTKRLQWSLMIKKINTHLL